MNFFVQNRRRRKLGTNISGRRCQRRRRRTCLSTERRFRSRSLQIRRSALRLLASLSLGRLDVVRLDRRPRHPERRGSRIPDGHSADDGTRNLGSRPDADEPEDRIVAGLNRFAEDAEGLEFSAADHVVRRRHRGATDANSGNVKRRFKFWARHCPQDISCCFVAVGD